MFLQHDHLMSLVMYRKLPIKRLFENKDFWVGAFSDLDSY